MYSLYSRLPQQSAAVKVVGVCLSIMFAIKFLFPTFVSWLGSEWQALVQGHSHNQLVFFGFLVFASTYWGVGLLFLVGPDLNHVPAFLWRAKYQPKREFNVNGGPFNPSLKQTLLNAISNQVFVFLPGFYLLHYTSQRLGFGLQFSPELPSMQEISTSGLLQKIKKSKKTEIYNFSTPLDCHRRSWFLLFASSLALSVSLWIPQGGYKHELFVFLMKKK